MAQSDGSVGVYVNGELVHSEFRGRLLSVTAFASADGGAFGVGSGVAGTCSCRGPGSRPRATTGSEVTAEPVPGVRPVAPLVPAEPARLVAVGADFGFEPRVRVYDPDGSVRFDFLAFASAFTGGVRVAVGDFNGDGVPTWSSGPGPGGRRWSACSTARTGRELFARHRVRGGVHRRGVRRRRRPERRRQGRPGHHPGRGRRAAGAGASRGDGFSSVIADFFGIDDPNFRGGARAAVGDVNGDGIGDLLVAAGFGGGPRVAVFDGIDAGDRPRRRSCSPTSSCSSRRCATACSSPAGDLDGDGFADVIAGGGPGGGPRVFALSRAGPAGRRDARSSWPTSSPATRRTAAASGWR